ncbi:dicarboxylate symporter family protein, partial [Vibrio parahaemolyticus AQ3810]
DSYGSKHYW